MKTKSSLANSIGKRVRKSVSVTLLVSLLGAVGCKNFFMPLNSVTPGTGVVNTGDYAYVANVNTSSATNPIYSLAGFSVGAGTLTALSGFPFTLPFAPSLTVVNPSNTILYVAGSGVIYGYAIDPSGALTSILNAGQTQALANANIVSMVISPDGQWLLGLDVSNTAVIVDEFQIGPSGLLTLQAGAQYSLVNSAATIVPSGIAVAATGSYVAVSLGTGGDVLFAFDTTLGTLTSVTQVNPPSASSADLALAFDSLGATLYIARSGTDGGVLPYTLGNGGALTIVPGAPFAIGNGQTSLRLKSILIDPTGKFLYVGNQVDGTISGFSIGNGAVLTQIAGSPFSSGQSLSALAGDNTGKYLLSAAIGLPDVSMYSYDATSPGKLDAATTASTGFPTEPAGALAIAMTH